MEATTGIFRILGDTEDLGIDTVYVANINIVTNNYILHKFCGCDINLKI